MKHQQGLSAFNLLIVLLIVGAVAYNFLYLPSHNRQVINNLRATPPAVTPAVKQQVDEFKSRPHPEFAPSGKYVATGEIEGKDYSITYYFGDDNTVTKDLLLLDEYRLTGSAKFEFKGSVMTFSEITGDLALFSETGEPITVQSKDVLVIPGETHPITLKSSAMIEQEAAEADFASSKRNEMLASKSFFELSPADALEKAIGSGLLPVLIFFLLLPAIIKAMWRMFDGHESGY